MKSFAFGYLKLRLFHRHAKTLNGLWKVVQEVWNGISLEMIQNTFQAWKRRLRAVTQLQGEHIEQTKIIHKRRIYFMASISKCKFEFNQPSVLLKLL